MIEHWEKTIVSGSGEKVHAREIILHRRGADVVGMAMRRNPEMTRCDELRMSTWKSFTISLEDDNKHWSRADIPHDDRREEWNW